MKLALLLFALPLAQDETIDGQPYEKLSTRKATLEHMRELLMPTPVTWGDWHLLSAFPYAGHGEDDLATVLAPEVELAHMAAGGPGPDLATVYTGKNGTEARWRNLGDVANRMVELHVHEDPELQDFVSCYLYAPLYSETAQTIEVSCGSDDGMRLWLNGRLLVDRDVPRGLNPNAHQLALALEPGFNHIFVKVVEGAGGWAFQMNYRKELSSRSDALLQYYLDRDFPPSPEREHYAVMTVPVPAGLVLEVGGLDFAGDGDPMVATRRGDVIRVKSAYEVPPVDPEFELFASGLHEPLGLAVRMDGDQEAAYAVQRAELTRLVDENGDGTADLYGCYSNGWGVSGNYHEFAFGPEFDRDGNAWVTLNVGFCGSLGKSIVPHRGWALKITPAGEVLPVCDGLRSPNGLAAWTDGEMFYVDNQGDYVATNRLSHLKQGSWHGHPASLRWREDLESPGDRPARQPASVWFPYRKMGQSAADIALAETGGRFGPFDGQFFVGDQTLASVMRVSLEQVEGHYQGACYPFLGGLQCGVNRVAFAPDGSMFVGQTDRGWGSIGRKPYGLQRIVYTGETPFEILEMRAREDGFELEFTQEVDPETATSPGSYALESYTYEYHAEYGAPEEDHRLHALAAVELVDARTVRLRVPDVRAGYVHELLASGVRSPDGQPLLHANAYYTLIRVPGQSVQEEQDDLPEIIFLTHSAGFTHGVVKRPDPYVLAYAEERLIEAAAGRYRVTATQDCAEINAERLSEVAAVFFYTTGELPIPGEGKQELLDWIHAGGAFIGSHCATDTFYEFPPYIDMIGGTFDGHPWHQDVTVRVEDAAHPAVEHLGEAFGIKDEIYQYRNYRRYPLYPLLTLDPESCEIEKGKRTDGDYALAWCKNYGQGRVFYTALGHREEVWDDPRFQELLLDGIEWAIDGPDYSPPPPLGATLLFDGTGVASWRHRSDERAAEWELVDGALQVKAGTGDVVSRSIFGDALIHVEFMTPSMPEAEGQQRGNSGVYVQGRYEVQVLDSFGLELGMGDCGSIYGVKIADVNAARPPEVWQTYDIEFTAPRFDLAGKKTESARMTVWHNGRLIHDDVVVDGPTTAGESGERERGPLLLQDHGNPVRYRNVWVLERRG